ncbi:MAG: signal peptidase II [Dehalococcoidia bacterium]
MINEQGSAPERSPATAMSGSDIAPSGRDSASPRRPRRTALVAVAFVVILLDQITKRLIDHYLLLYQSWPSETWPVHLTHAANSGAAFSILQNQTGFLIFTSLVGLGAIVLFFLYPPFDHGLLRFALGLQLGGAVGNLIDRVALGTVTDFIAFPYYPAFNIADSSIVIGVIILVWFLLFRDDRGGHSTR